MKIVSRAEAGLLAPRRPWLEDNVPWPRMWLHHTATPEWDAKAAARAIQSDHFGRGWRDIAYNFLVDVYGNVVEGIPVGARHLNSDKGFSGSVCLVGDFEKRTVPAPMIDSVGVLLAHGFLQGWWSGAGFTGGHSQIPGAAATLCPGRYGLAAIPIMDSVAAQTVKQVMEVFGDGGPNGLAGDGGVSVGDSDAVLGLGNSLGVDEMMIVKTKDPKGNDRYALVGGVFKSEFVSVPMLSEARKLGLSEKTVSWQFFEEQLVNARKKV